jgi:hypothetical protein
MSTHYTPSLTLPHDAIANPASDHDARLDRARAFLASRGIHEPRPLVGARDKPVTLNARLAAPLARWMHSHGAANDDPTRLRARRECREGVDGTGGQSDAVDHDGRSPPHRAEPTQCPVMSTADVPTQALAPRVSGAVQRRR